MRSTLDSWKPTPCLLCAGQRRPSLCIGMPSARRPSGTSFAAVTRLPACALLRRPRCFEDRPQQRGRPGPGRLRNLAQQVPRAVTRHRCVAARCPPPPTPSSPCLTSPWHDQSRSRTAPAAPQFVRTVRTAGHCAARSAARAYSCPIRAELSRRRRPSAGRVDPYGICGDLCRSDADPPDGMSIHEGGRPRHFRAERAAPDHRTARAGSPRRGRAGGPRPGSRGVRVTRCAGSCPDTPRSPNSAAAAGTGTARSGCHCR